MKNLKNLKNGKTEERKRSKSDNQANPINHKIVIIIALIVSIAGSGVLFAQNTVERIDAFQFGGYSINDVEFSAPYLLLCGDRATLMYITDIDKGYQKANVNLADSIVLTDIALGTQSMSTCVGSDGTILRSIDTGKSWTPISSGTLEYLHAVAISTDGRRQVAVGTNGIALLSTDAGMSWSVSLTGTVLTLFDVLALPDGTFIAVGGGGLIATLSPGSASWSIKITGLPKSIYSCYFTDAQTGWIGITGGILYTSDGGTTFSERLTGIDGSITDIANDGLALAASGGSDGTIAVSMDGLSWLKISIDDSVATKGIIISATEGDVVVVGDDGMVRAVTYPVVSQTEVGAYNAPFYFDHIKLSDGSIWSVGSNGAVNSLSRAGRWTMHETGTTELLTGIAANTDGSILCVSSVDGTVLRSSNGGSTWNSISLPSQTPLSSISFNGSFWTVGRENVFISSDGSSWRQAGSITGSSLLDVEAISSTEAYVFGTGGVIEKTTDGGSTWKPLVSNVTSTIMDGSIDASGTGILVGQYGLALATTDGGGSFTPLTILLDSDMFTAVDADASTGRVVATTVSGKIIYRAGPTSQWQIFDGATQLTDVMLTNDEITAVGEGGTVIRLPLSAVSVEESALQNVLLVTPNPANETIEVTLSEARRWGSDGCLLVVTSIDGKIVKNVKIEQGRNGVNVDVSGLPIGVYSFSAYSKAGTPIGSSLVTLAR